MDACLITLPSLFFITRAGLVLSGSMDAGKLGFSHLEGGGSEGGRPPLGPVQVSAVKCTRIMDA
jgi:hypothetical protein